MNVRSISAALLALVLVLSGCVATPAPATTPTPPSLATPAPEGSPPVATEPAVDPSPTPLAEDAGEATPAAPESTAPAEPTAEPAAEPTEEPAAEAPAELPAAVRLEPVAEGLTAPVGVAFTDAEGARALVIDQVGLVRVLNVAEGLLPEPFLDLRDRMVAVRSGYDERGLLGIALHPGFAENGRLFVYYSAPLAEGGHGGWDHTSHVSEFAVSPDSPDRADPASERVILQVHQPQANHNGGALAFGPDGYLYISLGDGGAAHDVGQGHSDIGNGQDRTNLLGSILRIDVDGEAPYSIPADNPFLSEEAAAAGYRPEIWAYGFRNPFRMAFDAGGDGTLFAGDVGQALWEELDIVEAGGNYGWRIREGFHCFSPDSPGSPPAECPEVGADGEPLIDPIVEYGQPGTETGYGNSVIAGYVYRGEGLPGLVGRHVFGDWTGSLSGSRAPTLLVASRDEASETGWTLDMLPVADAPTGFVLAFGQDPAGEMYVLTTASGGPSGSTGAVWRIAPAS